MTRLEDGRWADGLHLRCRKPECPSGDLLGCYAGSQGMKSASWPISNGVQNDLTFSGPVGMNCSYRREEIWLPASHMDG